MPERRGEGERAAQEPWALALWALTLLFFLRVLGQALVAFAGVTFLPPMEAWYSGLVPYPVLLPAQVAILALMLAVNLAISRGRGYAAEPRAWLGRPLRWFAVVYAAAMVLRLLLTTGGRIPTAFHFVLAAYLLVLSDYQMRLARRAGRA